MKARRPGSPSLLEQEIREQPDALARFLAAETAAVCRLGERLCHLDLRGVMIAARGSSDNVARYAQYAFGIRNRLPVALAAPSLFSRYGSPPRLDRHLVLAISQSGRSPDVVGVVEEASRQGCPTVVITNAPDSPLAAAAADVIDLHAGPERAVAATKTYTTSLLAVAVLAAALADEGRAPALGWLPERVASTVEAAVGAVAVPDWLAAANRCAVIGRGYHYGTAYEVALKIKELSGIAAEAYSSADFLHGPIAAAGAGNPALLIAPSGAVYDDVAALVPALTERRTRLLVASDVRDLLDAADAPLPLLPGTPEWLSPVPAVVPGQVLAWRLAEHRGLDVDNPRGLRKVTETR